MLTPISPRRGPPLTPKQDTLQQLAILRAKVRMADDEHVADALDDLAAALKALPPHELAAVLDLFNACETGSVRLERRTNFPN